MAFGDQDMGVFFSDFTETVIVDQTAVQAIIDRPQDGIEFGGGSSGMTRERVTITIPSSAFSRLLRNGDPVTVAGLQYKVNGRDVSIDGLIATYSLEKA